MEMPWMVKMEVKIKQELEDEMLAPPEVPSSQAKDEAEIGIKTEKTEEIEHISDVKEEKTEEKVKKRLPKKRGRRRYKNQGYYDSSSGGEEADTETSRSPARKRVREVVHVRGRRPEASQPLVVPGQSPRAAAPPALPPTHHRAAGSLSGVQFPPGLLAANPGLVGAKPGSLVVVARKSRPTETP
jgi:hypothetical protein